MKLVIGLGNPGSRYARTRHNIGFLAVESLAGKRRFKISREGFSSFWAKADWEGTDVLFLLPQTYMNRSGEAVRQARDYYRIVDEDVIVVHDDLDLPLGKVKIAKGSGAAGHRGVSSIIEHLGTRDFYRVRAGIGRPPAKEMVEGYVLSPFSSEEADEVNKMICETENILNQWILKEA